MNCSKNLKEDGLSFEEVKYISERDYNKINERTLVHKGDVLFAMIGTIGNPTIVTTDTSFAIAPGYWLLPRWGTRSGAMRGDQRLESIYQQKLAALDELKQSLLQQAFTGQL